MHKYEFIANDIANLIVRNLYEPSTKLPSIRKSAYNYKAGINTVKEAYRQLEDRGYIYARPQSGYFVCHKIPKLKNIISGNNKSEKVPLSGISKLLSIILEKRKDVSYIDLAMASPIGESFYPAAKIRRLTSQITRTQMNIFTTYVLPPGSSLLRTQIAKRSLQLGMLFSVDDLILTHGTTEALSLALRATTKPGDRVAVETPTFFNLYPMIQDLGREVVEIPTSPFSGMCLDTLQQYCESKSVNAVITIPTGHNPLGFSMSVENRKRLAEIANSYQIPVIEDAMYAELQFEEPYVPNVKSFDKDGWVLVCASYTKTVAPDYRIGWIEAGRFRNIVQQLKFTTSVSESYLLSETLGMFFKNGGYDLHLRHLKKKYQANIDVIRNLVSQHFPKGTRVSHPHAGFILWLELPDSIDTLELFHHALEKKILCMPGVICSGDKRFSNCLRLAACFELTPKILDGIKNLGQLARKY